MSFNNKNLFALLGNDVEDQNDNQVTLPRELVKKSTSSKKADAPPPSADPARAGKPKAKPTGNEGAIKAKANNREKVAPASTQRKSAKPAGDRKSRTGKTDSDKKVKQAWGDNKKELETEVAAAADAEASDEEVVEAAPPTPAGKSLQEFLAEQAATALATKPVRQANEGAEDKWTASETFVKEDEKFVEASNLKKLRSKAKKEKNFLSFDASFADEKPTERKEVPAFTRGAKPTRGGAKPARGGKKPVAKSSSSKKAVVDDVNFPALN
ncbi:hypothetical protein BABINDRAFT_8194 [Babjeviella inositovora NRRL Y-12698]|uniref:Hyaluronan/mRNA-binding protein domain-containing protein n=1 Tax=Babjeviella inositovora NRRL Y-12698 TaxID=984486 RepID=A0A1E3QR98_9ASCO|nr:uncharacterized protein BABINDRAFT_8194 [Babjeviella inositovora NRRL Y-12698]ODQ80014.1 hypothetical protein BABINDRAFT_8194 [Babjeviella inositovora NRRL Y-12698]